MTKAKYHGVVLNQRALRESVLGLKKYGDFYFCLTLAATCEPRKKIPNAETFFKKY